MYPANDTVVGSITVPDPAAAVTVTCGFQPRYVKCVNINNLGTDEFIYGMTADTSLRAVTDGTISLNAADGITLTANGFKMGTDICDTAADVVRYIAVR